MSPSAAPIQAHIPSLQATAVMLLPGMRHARSLLDVSIRVLEYFAKHASKDGVTGTFTAPPKAEASLEEEAEKIAALPRAFGRLS